MTMCELPEEDVDYLDSLNLRWNTIVDNGTPWLLLYEFPIPPGYSVKTATLAIRIASYPAGKLDMVYFSPFLQRTDNKPIQATTPLNIAGENFQQWSRHYPWRPDEDTLATHLIRARNWLENEFNKR